MSDQCIKRVLLIFGWKSLGSIERTEGLMRYTWFLIPAGYCGGSPGSPMDHPDFMGKRTLFHQVLKVQSHLDGLRIYIVPESILPLGLTTFFPSWYLSPLMAEECRQYNDPAVAKIYTPRWTGVCLISFEVLLSVIGELAFSQMLKFWMSFNDFVYIIVVFIF